MSRNDSNYKQREADEKFTLKDEQTSLYLHVKTDKLEVRVDKGITKDIVSDTKRCDFLLYDKAEKTTHLIELKGEKIDRAYKQLAETIRIISDLPNDKHLLEKLDILEAYIVSPHPKLPKDLESKERILSRALSKRCNKKLMDLLDLIHYVQVVPKANGVTKSGRRIIISGKYPLSL